jgi:hypothetical protein
VGDALVLEELDEIDREEAFADTALAIEDENETFHALSGLSIRTCAMRGPRVRPGGASFPLESAGGFADAPASLTSVESAVDSPPFVEEEIDERFRPGRLRGRTISPIT